MIDAAAAGNAAAAAADDLDPELKEFQGAPWSRLI
jgi:hypothetical protein